MKTTVPSGRDDELDIREAARREARHDGLPLGEWLDAVMSDRAAALGLSVSDLDPNQRIEAVMVRLGRSPTPDATQGQARFKLRAGPIDDSAAQGSEPEDVGCDPNHVVRRDGMVAVATRREPSTENILDVDSPAVPGAKMSSEHVPSKDDAHHAPAAEPRIDEPSQVGPRLQAETVSVPGLKNHIEASSPEAMPSRAERVANAASRQAAQRIEIETKLNALFQALHHSPRRSAHAASSAAGDDAHQSEEETRLTTLLGETAISPPWRLEKAIGEIAERQAFLERQAVVEGASSPPTRPVAVAKTGGPRAEVNEGRPIERPTLPHAAVPPMGEAHAAPVPTVFTSLQGDIARLAKRLDAVHFDVSRRPAPAPERRPSIDELRALVGELRPDASIDGLGRQVEELSAKLDRMHETRVPADTITRLSQRIDEVHADVAARLSAQAATPALDMAAIEQLIRDLIQRADRPGTAPPELRGLEEAVQELSIKLDEAERSHGGPQLLAELQAQVGQLATRIDKSDAGLAAIVAMERSLGDIFTQIGGVRDAAIQAAESTARAAAQETLRAAIAETRLAPPPSSSSSDAAVEQVSHDLADLRANRDEADKQLHAILAALNTSLERVVDRLGALEEDAVESRHWTVPSVPASAAPLDARSPSLAVEPAPVHPVGWATTGLSASPVDLDVPIEPGSAIHQRLAPPAPDTIASPPPSAPDPTTFIAAARRAAQIAAAEQGLVADAAAIGRTRLGGLATAPAASTRLKARMLTRRRPLLLALASLIVLLGAAEIVRLALNNGDPAPSVPAIQTPAISPAPVSPELPKAAPGPRADAGDASTANAPAQTASLPAETGAPASATDGRVADKGDREAAAAAAPASSSVASVGLDNSDPVAAGKKLPTMAMGPAANLAAVQAADLAARAAAAGGVSPGLRALADDGNAGAQYEIGLRYADGRGVPRDLTTASSWFDKAAKQGLAPAAYRLGSLYEKGLGVARDPAKSVALYQKAADAGNVRAMHNLAVMLAEGAAGKSDYATAASWFTKAAEAGVRDSQFNLAILYARGMGVEQNLTRSYTWFAIAAGQGDIDSAKKRDEVAARLDAKALDDAKQAADTFKPDAMVASANEVTAPAGGWDAAMPARPTSAANPKALPNTHVGRL